MSFRKFYYVYLKNREFLQDFKNLAGGKLKLPKKESPAGIGRVCMSACFCFLLNGATFSILLR